MSPLLTSSIYPLSHSSLRQDGRRWNELRRIHARISVSASTTGSTSSADGSAYLEWGNTRVLCLITGPTEQQQQQRAGGGGGGAGASDENRASVEVEVLVAGFSSGAGNNITSNSSSSRSKGPDRRTSALQQTISQTFSSPSTLFTALYPRSTIRITLHILSADGAVLAACVNATTLALIDAGVPMGEFVVACSAGSVAASFGGGGRSINNNTNNSGGGGGGGAPPDGPEEEQTKKTTTNEGDDDSEPLLDLNKEEESEVPFLTVATVGAGEERVGMLVMDSRVEMGRVEGMLAVAVDGCQQIREILDSVVREHGGRVVAGGMGLKGW